MATSHSIPTVDEVRQLLHYDTETGIFTWKRREQCRPEWNTRYAGTRAGSIKSSAPGVEYRQIRIHGIGFYEHRLAWLYVTGEWPEMIDHIDGDGLNNRFDNLRLCTYQQNIANSKTHRNNGRGIKGVSLSKGGRYSSRLYINRRCVHAATFDTPEEAHAAYLEAARTHFGEFARG